MYEWPISTGVIRAMQTKYAGRCYYIPVRRTEVKKISSAECLRKRAAPAPLAHCRRVKQPPRAKDWPFLMKRNANLPQAAAIALLGIYSGETKTYVPA